MHARWRSMRRSIAAVVSAVILTAMMAGSVAAGRPDTVDPALMTPPLNPSFTWECWRTGTGIVCDGERTLTYTAIQAIPCPDGGWIYVSGTDQRTLRRVGDSEGRALRTFETVRINDRLSRSAEFDGVVGVGRGIWTDVYEYPIPGDLASRIVTRRGIDAVVTIPGHGTVAIDVGIRSWDIDENILFARGNLIEDIEAAFATACDALAGESS